MNQHHSGDPVGGGDPPRGDAAVGALTLVQFFVGGFVLFVAAVVLMMAAPATSEYDGVMSIISVGITAVVIAVLSMIAAMCVGLPLRLVPALRSRWLANGEMTVAGAGLGLIVCAAVIAAMATNSGEGEAPPGPDTLFAVLTAGWALLAISVAHFVWPARWKRTASG